MRAAASTTAFDFQDVEPRSVPVKYAGRTFTLHEPTEAATARYQNAKMWGAQSLQSKAPTDNGMVFSRAVLVAACLKEVKGGAIDLTHPVTPEDVGGWRPKVVRDLFEWCKAAGEIDVEEVTEESLTRQIADLQQSLADLKAAGGDLKNG